MSLSLYKQQLSPDNPAQAVSVLHKPAISKVTHSSLKLAVVTETWYPDINGVAHSLRKIVSGLLDIGVEIQLFYVEQPNAKIDHRIMYFPQKGLNLPFYKEVKVGYLNSSKLQKQWNTNRPDIIQIVTEGPLGYSAMQAADRLNIPTVSDYRTNFQQYSRSYHLGAFEGIVFAYLRRLHNKTKRTLVPTQQLSDELKRLGFRNVSIISRGIDTDAFTPQKRSYTLRKAWQVNDDQIAVIYVGRIAPEKNLSLAVDAFYAIKQYQPSARFILVGDGPIRQQLEQEHPDFIFCGMKTGEDLYQHYASGDIFLSPSTTETFGNTLLEAMASGLAVLSYDYAAAKEHIIHKQNGVKAPFENEEAFIELAIELAKNSKQRKAISQQAYDSIRHNSWKKVSQNLLTILYQTIEEQNND